MMPIKNFCLQGLVALGCLGGLASCECTYLYEYTINNQTDTTIFVQAWSFDLDTTMLIPSGQSATMTVSSQGVESCGGPSSDHVNKYLDTFYVWRGTRLSLRDYRGDDTWVFTKNDHTGTYTAEVRSSEF